MNTEELIQEIVNDLTTELRNEENFDSVLLDSKVRSAVREVRAARKYPVSYSEMAVVNDLQRYYNQIKALALYDYSKVGAEGQNNYSADGENISYEDRATLFTGIAPICSVF
jgi:hypothetical protein